MFACMSLCLSVWMDGFLQCKYICTHTHTHTGVVVELLRATPAARAAAADVCATLAAGVEGTPGATALSLVCVLSRAIGAGDAGVVRPWLAQMVSAALLVAAGEEEERAAAEYSRRALAAAARVLQDAGAKAVVAAVAARLAVEDEMENVGVRVVACELLRDVALSCICFAHQGGACARDAAAAPLAGGVRREEASVGGGGGAAVDVAAMARVRSAAEAALRGLMTDAVVAVRETATVSLACLLRAHGPPQLASVAHDQALGASREGGGGQVWDVAAHVLAGPTRLPLSLRKAVEAIYGCMQGHTDAVVSHALWHARDLVREAAELRLLYSAGSDSGREREEETSDALLAHSTGELSYIS